jgi:phospholipid transport system transporter-binding protein
MSAARLDRGEQDGDFRLQGELTFATVSELLASSQPLLAACPHIRIDLAGVGRADSAGLALLAEWARRAALGRQAIDFINTPTQMRALAHVSGLDSVLPFDRVSGAQ